MTSSREIRRRIKSVKNIGKITKAMELVAASKMRKAQAAVVASRPYANLSQELISDLVSRLRDFEHPLFSKLNRDSKDLCVLISSDRGLAGALNSNVISSALKLSLEGGREKVDFITVGRKGTEAVKRFGAEIVAAFDGKDKDISIFDAKSICEVVFADYISRKYNKVHLVFTDFISTLSQRPKVLQLLPFESSKSATSEPQLEYVFEPNIFDILDPLIHRSIEFMIFQALLESAASEHSARMVAMRNANDAASDLIDDLTLSYNQARQAGITKELSEISAARLAME